MSKMHRFSSAGMVTVGFEILCRELAVANYHQVYEEHYLLTVTKKLGSALTLPSRIYIFIDSDRILM